METIIDITSNFTHDEIMRKDDSFVLSTSSGANCHSDFTVRQYKEQHNEAIKMRKLLGIA